jgi:hypothetical protein
MVVSALLRPSVDPAGRLDAALQLVPASRPLRMAPIGYLPGLMDELERAGLVTIDRDRPDRVPCWWHVNLTEAGRARRVQLRSAHGLG